MKRQSNNFLGGAIVESVKCVYYDTFYKSHFVLGVVAHRRE